MKIAWYLLSHRDIFSENHRVLVVTDGQIPQSVRLEQLHHYVFMRNIFKTYPHL